ncbi:hypothetical protein HD554DRAFT_2289775, partial [Boletus coccyginus]
WQQRAVGRLLQEVLTRSGDVTILAWTGKASDYNSCLPAEIAVYREPASPYVPSPIEDEKMDGLVTELRTSSKTVELAMIFYDRVIVLPSPRLASRCLSLSCIMFPLKGPLILSGDSPQHVYHATTSVFGTVEIKTTEDLFSLNNLVLIHPWLQCLLDPALPFEDDAEPFTPVDEDDRDGGSEVPFTNPRPASSYTVASSRHAPWLDKLTRALQLLARLKQPFGTLLLVPLSFDGYKRVASDHPIVVQPLNGISLRYLTPGITNDIIPSFTPYILRSGSDDKLELQSLVHDSDRPAFKATFPWADFNDAIMSVNTTFCTRSLKVLHSVLESTNHDHDHASDVLLGMNDPSFPPSSPPLLELLGRFQSALSSDTQRLSQESRPRLFIHHIIRNSVATQATTPYDVCHLPHRAFAHGLIFFPIAFALYQAVPPRKERNTLRELEGDPNSEEDPHIA